MLRTRLFEIADERGIRYTWLAKQLGYTPEYLSRIKHGTYPITEEFRRRVCALFANLDPDTLFFVESGDKEHHSVTSIAVAP